MMILGALAIAYIAISLVVVLWPAIRWIWLPVAAVTVYILNT